YRSEGRLVARSASARDILDLSLPRSPSSFQRHATRPSRVASAGGFVPRAPSLECYTGGWWSSIGIALGPLAPILPRCGPSPAPVAGQPLLGPGLERHVVPVAGQPVLGRRLSVGIFAERV